MYEYVDLPSIYTTHARTDVLVTSCMPTHSRIQMKIHTWKPGVKDARRRFKLDRPGTISQKSALSSLYWVNSVASRLLRISGECFKQIPGAGVYSVILNVTLHKFLCIHVHTEISIHVHVYMYIYPCAYIDSVTLWPWQQTCPLQTRLLNKWTRLLNLWNIWAGRCGHSKSRNETMIAWILNQTYFCNVLCQADFCCNTVYLQA